MASPSIVTTNTTNGTTASTTPVLNLPAGTVTAGNTLLVMVRLATGTLGTWPAGWNEIFRDSSDAADDTTAIAWKKADGTESGTTITMGAGTSAKFAAISWNISGADDPTTRAPECAAAAVGTTADLDPGTVTPTGGSKDYLFLYCGTCDGEPATWPPTGTPANYVTSIGASSGTAGVTTTNVRACAASRQTTASSENPGTWTMSSAPAQGWTATVVAVHPAIVVIPPPLPTIVKTAVQRAANW